MAHIRGKYHLLAFELDSPKDLCRIIYQDFLKHPSPKILFRDAEKIVYFTSEYLQGGAGNFVCFCFFISASEEVDDGYLVCSEDSGHISNAPDPKAPASIKIFSIKGLLERARSKATIDESQIRYWAIAVRANKDLISNIKSSRKQMLLIPKLGNYMVIVSKNLLKLVYIEGPAIYELSSLPLATFRRVLLFEF